MSSTLASNDHRSPSPDRRSPSPDRRSPSPEAYQAERLNAASSPSAQPPTPTYYDRYIGYVTFYGTRPKEQYGFVQAQGMWRIFDDGTRTFVPTNIPERIWFHASRVRAQHSESPKVLTHFSLNDTIEFELELVEFEGKDSYRARDVTALFEGKLPCQASVVTSMPYHVALRRLAQNQANRGEYHYSSVIRRYIDHQDEDQDEDKDDNEDDNESGNSGNGGKKGE